MAGRAGAGRTGAGRAGPGADPRTREYTGAFLVLLDDDPDAGLRALSDAAGVEVPTARAMDPQALTDGGPVFFDQLGVAVVDVPPGQQAELRRAGAASPHVLAVERERVLYALGGDPSADYLRGFRDGVASVVAGALGEAPVRGAADPCTQTPDESVSTWGLQAVRALESGYTGAGVRGCVLDTGVDTAHPDLADRVVLTQSFIAGELEDGHGHGTHCVGTAFGPLSPQTLPRYGVATGAEVYVGKVLSDAGSGGDRAILAGINWAITQGCRVISMSLGAPTAVGDTYSKVYEAVAQRALGRGSVIVAAAGNDSMRPYTTAPVSHPANCPSILAVAALDNALAVAEFSNAGLNPEGGQVDIAAPGVDVHSAWPEPQSTNTISGTSMATPHVAGVVALLAEAHPQASAAELKDLLLSGARRLELPSSDVGAGLLQAP